MQSGRGSLHLLLRHWEEKTESSSGPSKFRIQLPLVRADNIPADRKAKSSPKRMVGSRAGSQVFESRAIVVSHGRVADLDPIRVRCLKLGRPPLFTQRTFREVGGAPVPKCRKRFQ